MNRNLKIAALGLVLIVIFIYIVNVLSSSGFHISESEKVQNTFSTAVSYDANSLIFSNDRSFVTYNYTDGQTKQLSPDTTDTSLSGIDSLTVSPDKNLLLFHTASLGTYSALYDQLIQGGLNPDLDYWWVYNVSNNTYLALPQGIVSPRFVGDDIAALVSGEGGTSEAIIVYSGSDGHVVQSTNVVDSNNFIAVQSGYLLQTTAGDLLLISSNSVGLTIYSSSTLVGEESVNNTAAYVLRTQGSNTQLVLFDSQDKTAKVLANNIVGNPVVSDGVVLYSTGSSKHNTVNASNYYVYDSADKKSTEWRLSTIDGQSANKLALNPIAIIGNGAAIMVSTTQSNYYIIGNALASIKSVSSPYSRQVAVGNQQIPLSFNSTSQTFTAPLDTTVSLSTEQSAIYQQLERDGYNPNLYRLTWSFSENN